MCKTAKEIWEVYEVTHEGTKEGVKRKEKHFDPRI